MPYICHTWSTANVQWNLADWTWSECQLVNDILGAPGERAMPRWLWEESPYDAYAEIKKRKFIELLCKVEGKTLLNEKREINITRKITVNDIKLVVKAVAGIDVKITII
jgi:hypothetical protein